MSITKLFICFTLTLVWTTTGLYYSKQLKAVNRWSSKAWSCLNWCEKSIKSAKLDNHTIFLFSIKAWFNLFFGKSWHELKNVSIMVYHEEASKRVRLFLSSKVFGHHNICNKAVITLYWAKMFEWNKIKIKVN